jgi:hypothetical protein
MFLRPIPIRKYGTEKSAFRAEKVIFQMRSYLFSVIRFNCGLDQAEWLERRLTSKATQKFWNRCSIPAYSDTVESDGRQMKQ